MRVCQPFLHEGEPCPSGNGCGPGLRCIEDLEKRTIYCATSGGLGEPCNLDGTCDPGLICPNQGSNDGCISVQTADSGPDADSSDAADTEGGEEASAD